MAATVTDAALRAFDAFGCRGVARVDLFLTDGGVIMNEINTVPGMTADSQVPKMSFLISGVFARRVVFTGTTRRTLVRVGGLAGLYGTWALVQTVTLARTPQFDTEHADNLGSLLGELTYNPTSGTCSLWRSTRRWGERAGRCARRLCCGPRSSSAPPHRRA